MFYPGRGFAELRFPAPPWAPEALAALGPGRTSRTHAATSGSGSHLPAWLRVSGPPSTATRCLSHPRWTGSHQTRLTRRRSPAPAAALPFRSRRGHAPSHSPPMAARWAGTPPPRGARATPTRQSEPGPGLSHVAAPGETPTLTSAVSPGANAHSPAGASARARARPVCPPTRTRRLHFVQFPARTFAGPARPVRLCPGPWGTGYQRCLGGCKRPAVRAVPQEKQPARPSSLPYRGSPPRAARRPPPRPGRAAPRCSRPGCVSARGFWERPRGRKPRARRGVSRLDRRDLRRSG